MNIKQLYLGSQFFRAMYFAWPIWYGFASLTLNPIQIGLFFSSLIFSQLIFDIPTGVFADRFGRKISAIIGNLILAVAPLLIAFGHNFEFYIIASVFYGIGRSFNSGSLDALLYDHSEISKEDYADIVAQNIFYFQAGLLVSTFIGGFLYQANNTFPFIAESIASVICTAMIFYMNESHNHKSINKPRLSSIVKSGFKEIFSSTFIKIFICFNIPLSLILSVSNDYLNEAAMISNNIEPIYRGLLITVVKIVGLVFFYVFLLKNVKTNKTRIALLMSLLTISLLILSIKSLPTFLIGYLILNVVISIQTAFTSPVINLKISPSNRSTVLSSISTLTNFAKLFSSVIFSAILYYFGTNNVYIAFLILALLVIIPSGYLLIRKIDQRNY